MKSNFYENRDMVLIFDVHKAENLVFNIFFSFHPLNKPLGGAYAKFSQKIVMVLNFDVSGVGNLKFTTNFLLQSNKLAWITNLFNLSKIEVVLCMSHRNKIPVQW